MEKINYSQYRDDLANAVKKIPKKNRKDFLKDERNSENYQKSSIYKIENRYRKSINNQYRKWQENNISIDIDNPPTFFTGITGKYTFKKFSKEILDSIVRDEKGDTFFITPKRAERQAMSALLGNYLASKCSTLSRLKFPEIRLEQINNQTVALMEYFDNYKELDYYTNDSQKELDIFSDNEKAFLEIYNLWIGNWDFKHEHVLVSEGSPNNNKFETIAFGIFQKLFQKKNNNTSIGLIDLEMSFDSTREDRINQTVLKSVFLSEDMSEKTKNYILEIIQNLTTSDRNNIIKYAVDSGFKPEETIDIVFDLFKRRNDLSEEIANVRKIYSLNHAKI